jgi:hypothetical protein
VMYAIVDGFAQLVVTPPDPVVAAGHAGGRKPAKISDLPSVVVSVTIDDQRTTGLGRVMRSGEIVTRASAIVDVAASPDTFSNDLRRLRLAPLPLRKNPASVNRRFTGDDVTVTNVTDSSHPVPYRFATQPAAADEFAVDSAQALVTFGAGQKSGDKLEVVHWTVTWRDDVEGAAYRGVVNVDVWGGTFEEATAAARKLQDRVASRPDLLRQAGFSKLHGAGLHAAEAIVETSPGGGSFQAWRQLLAYRFSFEVERPAQDSSAGPIRRIDVDIEGDVEDELHLPRPTS